MQKEDVKNLQKQAAAISLIMDEATRENILSGTFDRFYAGGRKYTAMNILLKPEVEFPQGGCVVIRKLGDRMMRKATFLPSDDFDGEVIVTQFLPYEEI